MVYATTSAAAEGDGGSARDLAEYAEQKHEREETNLKNSLGEELDEHEKDHLIYQGEKDGYRRSVVLSTAEGNQISEAELDEKTQSVMNDYVEDRPSASYAFASHTDTDKIHSHAVVFGEKRDLYHDGDELSELKVNAENEFRGEEAARDLAENLDYDLDRDREQELGLGDDDLDRDRDDLGIDTDEILDVETEQSLSRGENIEIGNDHDRGIGGMTR